MSKFCTCPYLQGAFLEGERLRRIIRQLRDYELAATIAKRSSLLGLKWTDNMQRKLRYKWDKETERILEGTDER